MRERLTASYRQARALAAHRGVRIARTFVRRVVTTCAVILAIALVTSVTIDLGRWPFIKSKAEQEGSDFLERPLHIGRLSFRLWTGRFLLEDVVIEGLMSQPRPFLEARRIEVAVPWSTLLDRRIVLDSIEMTDWRVHLEVLENGKHSLPKLTPKGGPSERRRDWTTTLRWIRAHRGEFTYEDHGTPWSIVTRNLDVTVARPGSEYRGEARFSNGTVAIQDYVPFSAAMTSTFKIDGSRVVFDRIALDTDGAQTVVYGDVNLKHFPEMMYRVESTIDFGRMREIFFAREQFRLSGTGRFSGHFHLFKERRPDGTNGTGRDLFGTFDADRVSVGAHRFSNLHGSVKWNPRRLAVTEARADLYGGSARFGYEMAPLGVRGTRPTARFDARLADVSLRQLTDFYELQGMRLAGGVTGDLRLTWPLGRFAERHVSGALRVAPPPDVTLMTERVPVELIEQGRLPRGPAAPLEPLMPIPIGGDVTFEVGPRSVRLAPSTVATQRTFVRFEGSTSTGGEDATIPFAVSSADWQESYRLFAAMRTALGSPTDTIEIGGHGTVSGVATGNLRRPRIEAAFAGERMRVWNVEWGSARGRAVIENGYADVKETTVTSGASTIRADGRFALGVPRSDGGEQINATVHLEGRPIADLASAFSIERVPLQGLLSGEFHVLGEYRRPFGYGTLAVADGTAWGEPFEAATAKVALEGAGVRLSAIEMAKGGGRGSGAAYVDWDGAYSFDFTSVLPIPVEAVARLRDSMPPELPLSGLIDFRAEGAGSFDKPRFSVTGSVRDLFVADEGIGQVTVKSLAVNGDMLTVDAEVASARLDVDVIGQVELTDEMYGQVRFNVTDTSLDPYLRAFDPRLSPYTTAVVSGNVTVKGPLARRDSLAINAHVASIDMRLFDYRLRTAGAFDIEFDRSVVRIPRSRPVALYGDDTKLEIFGDIGLEDEQLAMTIQGDANLAVLQGFAPSLRSSGNASLLATFSGALHDPVAKGTLQIQNGRIRHVGAPLALERISGPIAFSETGVTLDGLTAEIGEGQVRGRIQFEGTIEQQGYLPGQINVTVTSVGERGVGLRYPEGMRSEVEIGRLTLRGTLDDMRLDGEVRIKDAVYSRPFPSNLIAFFTPGSEPAPARPQGELSLPLTYEGILIRAESSIRVDNSGPFSARLVSSANLELRGTFAQPVLFGEMVLDRGGEFTAFGKRYSVTQGTVFFNNPTKIEPSYDIEAETRVRVPGETYRITMNVRGTGTQLAGLPVFISDPPLSDVEVFALLVSDVAPEQDRELRRARGGTDAQERVLEVAASQVTAALASPVTQTIERTFGVDFVLTPTLLNPDLQSSRSEPGVRLLLGRRVYRRLYLTYARNLSTSTNDEIIVLEYDATDRVTWILSRNEDQTYAIEVRMRHTF